jgi:hypothetical protein
MVRYVSRKGSQSLDPFRTLGPALKVDGKAELCRMEKIMRLIPSADQHFCGF